MTDDELGTAYSHARQSEQDLEDALEELYDSLAELSSKVSDARTSGDTRLFETLRAQVRRVHTEIAELRKTGPE